MSCRRRLMVVVLLLGHVGGAPAQTISHRGFVEGIAFTFPQQTSEDRAGVVDGLLRERGDAGAPMADLVRRSRQP